MRKILALVLSLLWAALAPLDHASAQIVGTLPFTLQNGTIADANQVMSDLNTIVAAVNANAANAGVNTNINALNNLTTPLVYTSGGTSNYIGGTSGGSANAQTIASPIPAGFTLVTGKSVTFLAGFTNTGPTQLNVAGTGLTNVLKPGTVGPVALSGNEITSGNLVTATFDGTQYQITGVSPQSLVPACTIIDWAGTPGPAGYLLATGGPVSRTTFPTLFSCITVQGVAATTSSGSASVVVPNSALFQVGWSVGGNNVTCNSTILTIPDGTHITISANAGANGATTLTIGPYPQGDCSTTFGIPQLVGRATVMRDISGTILSAATCANFASQGSQCGNQTQTLLLTQLPTGITVTGSVSVNSTNNDIFRAPGNVLDAQTAVGTPNSRLALGSTALVQTITSTGSNTLTSNNTSGAAHPILPPVALVDKYIKF